MRLRTQAHDQIRANVYDKTYPRDAADQGKPAFYYGVKWTDKSTHFTFRASADAEAQSALVWKKLEAYSTEGDVHL
jgi:hypothetical protein